MPRDAAKEMNRPGGLQLLCHTTDRTGEGSVAPAPEYGKSVMPQRDPGEATVLCKN